MTHAKYLLPIAVVGCEAVAPTTAATSQDRLSAPSVVSATSPSAAPSSSSSFAPDDAAAPPGTELTIVGQPEFDTGGRLIESIGIETLGGVFTALLPAGCSSPCRATEVFSTASDSQDSVQVHLLQGRTARVTDARTLARFQIAGIAPALGGIPKIQVTIVATPRLVRISARDLAGGDVRLDRTPGG